MAKLSVAKVAKALQEHHGIIMHAAKACGVHRHTMRKFIDEHPELEEIRQQADEELLDIGENHVVNALKEGDMKTVRWHLERKGKNRGYSTRVESTGADGGPVEFDEIRRTYVEPAPRRDDEP